MFFTSAKDTISPFGISPTNLEENSAHSCIIWNLTFQEVHNKECGAGKVIDGSGSGKRTYAGSDSDPSKASGGSWSGHTWYLYILPTDRTICFYFTSFVARAALFLVDLAHDSNNGQNCSGASRERFITSEAEGRASSTENKGKSWVWATGRGHAFERLISLEPKARLTGGLLWWVPPFLLPCMGPMPNHASTHCGTWRVLPGGMSQMFRLLFLGNGWADCIEIW